MGREEPAEPLPHRKYSERLLALSEERTALHYKLLPSARDFIVASAGGGISFRFVIGEDRSRVELYIAGKEAATNDRIYNELLSHKGEIEATFRKPLSWERLEDSKSCRVAYRLVTGGSEDAESTWLSTQTAMVDAMVRLEKALIPFIPALKLPIA